MRESKQKIQGLLASLPGVTECAVVARQNVEGCTEWILYIVPAGPFEQERFIDEVARLLPDDLGSFACVAVSTIPIAPDGTVDVDRLKALPVIDQAIARSAEVVLGSEIPIDRVAGILSKSRFPARTYHPSDLLPMDVQSNATGRSATPEPAMEIPSEGPPSVSHGPALKVSLPEHLWSVLVNAVQTQPQHGITYVSMEGSESFQSYEDLLKDAERIVGGLRQNGIAPGDTVIFQLDEKREFVAAFWACALMGVVPAPIALPPTYSDSNAGVAKVYNCWIALRKPTILSSAALKPSILGIKNVINDADFQVLTIENLRRSSPVTLRFCGSPDDVALLLFTSGSTGSPKGVLLTQRNLLARCAATAERNGFDESDIVVNWFPLDHVGGIVMSHLQYTLAASCHVEAPSVWILENPLRWLDLLHRHRATCTWAPNFAFSLINKHVVGVEPGRWDLTTVRFILNGGEAIVPATALRFLELLGAYRLSQESMHPSWGMSETASGVLFSERCRPGICQSTDSFVEVGSPIPGTSVRVVDTQDIPVREGAIGRLQIRGLPVTAGYYESPELNAATFTQDGWFNTGDLARMRDGLVTITGRTKDVIIVNGLNHYCQELESLVEQVSGVEPSYAAASAVSVPGSNTDAFCVFFSPTAEYEHDPSAVIAAIRAHLSVNAAVRPTHVVPLGKDEIPKTGIGKIQRSELRHRFESGDYDAILRRLDVQPNSGERIPDWFFRRTWKPYRRDAREKLAPGTYLLFTDSADFTSELQQRIRREGGSFISVRRGETFIRESESQYQLDPTSKNDYRRLLAHLRESGVRPCAVLHGWTYAPWISEDSPDSLRNAIGDSNDSLLHLVQAFMQEFEDLSLRLVAISQYAQSVLPGDQLCPSRAVAATFLQTLALESSKFQCRHIDLHTESSQVAAEVIVAELRTPVSGLEVAYRQLTRYEPVLERESLLNSPSRPIPVETGGLYLISGGLGGLGTELVRELHDRYQIKALLIGSTELSEAQDGSVPLNSTNKSAARLTSYQALEAAGVDFLYQAVSLENMDALTNAVACAESYWGQPLRGVFHLAGAGNLKRHWEVLEQHWIRNESVRTFEWMFETKVWGTVHLHRLLKERGGSLFVAFSSITSLFGGATFSAYSCANRFLDAFCSSKAHESGISTYCINWSMWDQIGMSEGGPEFGRQAASEKGFLILGKEQGLISTFSVLSRGGLQTIVGLDARNAAIRAQMHGDCEPLQVLRLFYSGKGKARLSSLLLQDRFGTSFLVPCISTPLRDWDSKVLVETDGSRQVRARTPEEEQMVWIWRDALNVPSLGVTDSFFDLGGDSLTAIRLVNRIREELHVELSMRSLFEAPTVERLVASVVQTAHRLPPLPTARQMDIDIDSLADHEVDLLLKKLGVSENSL